MQTHSSDLNQHSTSHKNAFLKLKVIMALILTAMLSFIVGIFVTVKINKISLLGSNETIIKAIPTFNQSNRSKSAHNLIRENNAKFILPIATSSGSIIENRNKTKTYTNFIHKYKITYPSDWVNDRATVEINGEQFQDIGNGLILSKNSIKWMLDFNIEDTGGSSKEDKRCTSGDSIYINNNYICDRSLDENKIFTIFGEDVYKQYLINRRSGEIYYVIFVRKLLNDPYGHKYARGFSSDSKRSIWIQYDGDSSKNYNLNKYMNELDLITSSLEKFD